MLTTLNNCCYQLLQFQSHNNMYMKRIFHYLHHILATQQCDKTTVVKGPLLKDPANSQLGQGFSNSDVPFRQVMYHFYSR